ncbi:hypothetical protein Tco_1343784 [Tanacetum coccineum]
MFTTRRFIDPDHPTRFLPAKKALYGLKTSSRELVDGSLKIPDFKRFLLKYFWTSDPPIPTRYLYQSGQIYFRDSEKHGMEKGQSVGTPMATKPKLDVDLSGKLVDQTDYRSKIGSLMYLTSNRPDIVQAGTINMGLWYPKDSGFELTAFSDADHD